MSYQDSGFGCTTIPDVDGTYVGYGLIMECTSTQSTASHLPQPQAAKAEPIKPNNFIHSTSHDSSAGKRSICTCPSLFRMHPHVPATTRYGP